MFEQVKPACLPNVLPFPDVKFLKPFVCWLPAMIEEPVDVVFEWQFAHVAVEVACLPWLFAFPEPAPVLAYAGAPKLAEVP
jgi:hypothetical protein